MTAMTITHCPPYFFESEAARDTAMPPVRRAIVERVWLRTGPQAIAAAGAIIAYLEKMNGKLLSLLTGLRSYRTTQYMVLDAHTQRNLDLLARAVVRCMAVC